MASLETIRPKEAAEKLGVHVVTVRKMCAEGKFKVININEGGKKPTYLIVKESFDEYLGRQAQ